ETGITLDGAVENTIGTLFFQGGNIISGNLSDGVRVADSHSNAIQNNFIGTTRVIETSFGNGGAGIHVTGTSENNALGTIAGFGNIIEFNEGDGIRIVGANARFNPIRENYYFGNGGTPIALLEGAQEGI